MNEPTKQIEPLTPHHDSFSNRGWLLSDKRHKRALAAFFYTFVIPLMIILGIFALLHLFLAVHLVQCALRFAWNY